MIPDKVEVIEKLADFMNDLLDNDPEAITKLVGNRVIVKSRIIIDHSTVIVGEEKDKKFSLGIIGLINGLIDLPMNNRLGAEYDEDGKLIGFRAVDYSDCLKHKY